nr:hypothetical protein [Eubacterium sp.]
MMEHDFFKLAIEYVKEIVLFFDAQGKIQYANRIAKESLEYGEEIYQCTISDIFPSICEIQGGNVQILCALNDVVSGNFAYRQNRTCFQTETQIIPSEEQKGFYVCMAKDVSARDYLERKVVQAGQEMEEAEKVKTQFVANVTHELRTPVNGILGNTRELLLKEEDPKKQKILQLVQRGCDDMNAIINNILDFSKLEAGKFSLDPHEFVFREMMDYVKNNHISRIVEKGLELFMTISPEIPEKIIADELRIVQILNNLLSNACKFTSVGKIMVEVVKTAQIGNRIELFFIVIDSGIGIDKAGQDKLFQSFSQVEASISRKYGGTGLGLNISKQLVELMDGNIHVESELGKGTTFSFHIWVDVPQGTKVTPNVQIDMQAERRKLVTFISADEDEKVWKYGEEENLKEIEKKMSKLILSVEMENWEKAEMFADTLKQLLEEAPREIKSGALRLKMAVQKGDYEKTQTAYEKLKGLLEL